MSSYYLYVTPFFPSPQSWRGAVGYDFVRALHEELTKRSEGGQWKVLVFKEGSGADYEINGVKVYTFPVRRLPSNVFPNLFAKWNQKSFLSAVRRAGVNVNEVAICHGNVANYAIYPLAIKAENPSCRAILQHHDLQSFGLNMGRLRHCWLYNMIQFPVLRRMHEKIDTHVFISEACRRSFLAAPDTRWTEYAEYKKQMRGLPYRSVRIGESVILHNGVNKDVFKVEKVGGGGQRRDNSFIIGCVGNFQVLKDQETLIRAVARVNEVEKVGRQRKVKIRFVGSGETLVRCRQLAQKLDVDAEFLTEMRHEQLPEFYRSLDLFVLPTWFEGFGCVLTEAHACGTPFITCEGQGIDDVIPAADRGKWLCRKRDPEDLAKKISSYIENRWEQRLSEDQDINSLVGKFVDAVVMQGGRP